MIGVKSHRLDAVESSVGSHKSLFVLRDLVWEVIQEVVGAFGARLSNVLRLSILIFLNVTLVQVLRYLHLVQEWSDTRRKFLKVSQVCLIFNILVWIDVDNDLHFGL